MARSLTWICIAVLLASGATAAPPGAATDIGVAVDCSGGMGDRLPDGRTKMEAVRLVLAELVAAIPAGRRLTLVTYGQDKAARCDAVRVVRPLAALDDPGKAELANLVAEMAEGGNAPIKSALLATADELKKGQGLRTLVLISGGFETCGGRVEEAAERVKRELGLAALDVVGLAVKPAERKQLEAIAAGGGGTFLPAESHDELRQRVEELRRAIVRPPDPAPIAVGEGLGLAGWTSLRRLSRFGPEDGVALWHARLSADGSRIAYASSKGLFVRGVGGAGVSTAPVRLGEAANLADLLDLSADGSRVAWADEQRVVHQASADGTPGKKLPRGSPVDALRMDAAGRTLFSISEQAGTLSAQPTDGSAPKRLASTAQLEKLLNAPVGNAGWRTNPGTTCLGVSDDGERIAFRFGFGISNLFVIASDGTDLRALTHYTEAERGSVTQVAISGDGRTVAAYVANGKDDQTVRIFDWEGKELATYRGVGPAISLVLSRDGAQAVATWGLRSFARDGSGWRSWLEMGPLPDNPLGGARMATFSGDMSRGCMLVDRWVDARTWGQLLLVEVRPPALVGVPVVKTASAEPAYLMNDGSTTLAVEATFEGAPLACHALVVREGKGTGRIAEAVGLAAREPAGATRTFASDGVRSGRGPDGKPHPAGPAVVRVVAADREGGVVILDLSGVEVKDP